MLSHVDRSRVITDEDGRIFSRLLTRVTGLGLATIIIDGLLRGTWRVTRNNKIHGIKGPVLLTIWPFQRPSPTDRSALEEEGARLLASMEPKKDTTEIDIKDPDRWLPAL